MSTSARIALATLLFVITVVAIGATAVAAEEDAGSSDDSEYGNSLTAFGSDDVGSVAVSFYPNSTTATGGYTQYVTPGNKVYLPSEYKAEGDGNSSYTQISNDGYVLLGWSTNQKATAPDSGCYPGMQITVNRDRNYYAVWSDLTTQGGTQKSSVYEAESHVVKVGTSITFGLYSSDYLFNYSTLSYILSVDSDAATFSVTHNGDGNSRAITSTGSSYTLDGFTLSIPKSRTGSFSLSGTPSDSGIYKIEYTVSYESSHWTGIWYVSSADATHDPSILHHVTLDGEDNGRLGPYGTVIRLPDAIDGSKTQTGWQTTVDGNTVYYPLGGAMTISDYDRQITASNLTSDDVIATGLVGLVAYNVMGGTSNGRIAYLVGTDGTTVLAESDVATKSGYTCIGWNGTGSSTDAIYPFKYVYDMDKQTYVEMRAVWVASSSSLTSTTASFQNPSNGDQTQNMVFYAGYSYYLPTKGFDISGYEFQGWSSTSSNPGKGSVTYSDKTVSINTSTTFYAVYKAVEYDVTIIFKANGGLGTMPSQTAKTLTIELAECTYTRSGYEFLGWSKTSSASSASIDDGATITVDGSGKYILYAIWSKSSSTTGSIAFTINYHGNGSNVYNVPSGTTVTSGVKAYTLIKSYKMKGSDKTTVVSEPTGLFLTRAQLSEKQSLPSGYESKETRTMYGIPYTISSQAPALSSGTFQGWARTATGTAEMDSGDTIILIVGFDEMPSSCKKSVSLYAVWKGSSSQTGDDTGDCKVTFKTWEGTAAVKTCKPGTAVTEPTVKSRDGYSLIGWQLNDGTLWDFKDPVTETMTLTTVMTHVFDLVIDGNSVTPKILVNTSSIKVSFSDGSSETYTATSLVKAHTVAQNSSGTVTVTVITPTVRDSADTLTATASYNTDPDAKQTCTVTFYDEDGTAIAEQDVKEGEKATRLTDPEGGKYYYYTDAEHTKTYRFDAVTTDTSVYVLEREDVYDGLTLAEIAGAAIAVIGVGLIIAGFVYNPYLAIIGAILAAFGGCELLGVFSLLGRIL